VAKDFRIGRLRIPARLTQRWRARLRAQRRWWRSRRRRDGGEVLFPAVGQGMVAVHTLGRGGETGRPRVAILHATAGSGHKSAAEALAAALAGLRPGAAVCEVDTLVFASGLYRSTYAASYNAMAARAPRLWGALYHSWGLAPVNKGTAPVRLTLDRLNLRRLVRVVEREAPDAIVCTHFLPVEALSPRRGRGSLKVPLFCVITDFAAHPFWAFPHVDLYFVAADEVADELAGHGVPRERIEVTGIPVHPRFARGVGRRAAREQMGLAADRPVVLVMGGGSGVGPVAELATHLARLAARPQVVAVCGTNPRLRQRIAALPEARAESGGAPDVVPLGFTRDVDRLLEACDLVVGKAGGLTCSEALIKGAPLVVFKPTPGQEVRNAQYLERHGAAIHADTVEEVVATVEAWLQDPGELRRRRQAARAIARPHAAETVARRVLARVIDDPAAARVV
jgi:processive 1,2-diacylglycerol beta-glucosyltransferase